MAADDEIDAMNVSLMERCHEVLRREAPVASDLRFVVSVLRVLSELERIGDLALRVHRTAATEHALLTEHGGGFHVLLAMADEAIGRFRTALRAWATLDLRLSTELATAARTMDLHFERLMAVVVGLDGPNAARVAVAQFAAGRALERIGDHAGIIGARLRYLITGDPDHLAAEVR
jgi:phosphate transport system protein